MKIDLGWLEGKSEAFARRVGLTVEQIGMLADRSETIAEFQERLDAVCRGFTKQSFDAIREELSLRLPDSSGSTTPEKLEGKPQENETLKTKLEKLKERDAKKETK